MSLFPFLRQNESPIDLHARKGEFRAPSQFRRGVETAAFDNPTRERNGEGVGGEAPQPAEQQPNTFQREVKPSGGDSTLLQSIQNTAAGQLLTKASAFLSCAALLNSSVPMSALITYGTPIREAIQQHFAEAETKSKEIAKRRCKSGTRLLTAKEQKAMQGRSGENPYLAGQNKWDVIYKGVNLMTGNFTTSSTDLSFEGGYGIPVNVTRSYSANNPDEGPFGKGWTLSADVRSTAGGLLKSAGAPVRAVPTDFKERPSAESDPNAELANGVAAQPPVAVIAVDAGGKEETIQKDVDGILTTPPWDNNTMDSVYEWVTLNGSRYQVLLSNSVKTPDGTIYTYAKQGSFPNGTVPWNNPSATPEAANVLKVMSATDRQGNVATYSYGSGWVTFQKSNGLVQEHPLIGVQMPNGHQITFTWGDGSTGHPANRVWKVSDNGNVRVCVYGYDANGLLTSFTTPGGKTNSYGYGAASAASSFGGAVKQDALTSITSPQGLSTLVHYEMIGVPVMPSMYRVPGVVARTVTEPNWLITQAVFAWTDYSDSSVSTLAKGTATGRISQHLGSKFNGSISQSFWEAYVSSGSSVQVHFYRSTDSKAVLDDSDNRKTYDLTSQAMVEQSVRSFIVPNSSSGSAYAIAYDRKLVNTQPAELLQRDQVSYNFLGNKLSASSTESLSQGIGGVQTVTKLTSVAYSYWGSDKYFQQKAVRSGESESNFRFSYTDYYPATAAPGKRGQTYRVYDPKHAQFIFNTNNTVPAGTAPGNVWKYQVEPSSWSNYSAQFDYDAKGRPIDVWKLQNSTTSPWSYVATHTSYGSDSDGSWGQASQVTEDSGGINRTTQTLHYTSWGKADRVQDAKGQIFQTYYDLDGQVQSVVLNGTTAVANYAYGTTPGTVEFGQPISVQDGLSGVTQTISYTQSGGGLGQPSGVSQTGGGQAASTVAYTYNATGNRSSATYTTPHGTSRWGYRDYLSIGDPVSPKRVFQTLSRLDASGNPTAEEFHYAYDTSGRVLEAAFAQSPQAGFTPSAGSAFYDSSHLAATRGRTHYEYDAGGRITKTATYWDTLVNGAYQSQAVLANTCGYAVNAGLNRGLKTSSTFWKQDPSNTANFLQEYQESYGYDSQLDYLTSFNTTDGIANPSQTWSYDAAGNRNDAVTDNLNRATSLGGVSCTNDILGNRLTNGAQGYAWDALNRMTAYTSSGSNTTYYTYRADGMRVSKTSGANSTNYFYDGQMGIEDVEVNGGTTTVTDYALGARGIDAISTNGSVTYPIYDAHGNMVATLAKAGTSYFISNRRDFDPWGNIRGGATAGDPKNRYCANLGHKQDDESGLTYMRGRFYDSLFGRFTCEDPTKAGGNWHVYCSNDPVNFSDESGHSRDSVIALHGLDMLEATLSLAMAFDSLKRSSLALPILLAGIAFLASWFLGNYRNSFADEGDRYFGSDAGGGRWNAGAGQCWTISAILVGSLAAIANGVRGGETGSIKDKAQAVCEAYVSIITMYFALDGMSDALK